MIEIFISYAHQDKELMNSAREHLRLFDRKKLIHKWYDRDIRPGSKWKKEIDHHLKYADIILLLVSSSFFDSDYCYEVEMRQVLQQHEESVSVVIPVILRPCLWHDSPFGHLKALPKDGRPITEWENRDSACKDVAKSVMEVVAELESRRKANPPSQ